MKHAGIDPVPSNFSVLRATALINRKDLLQGRLTNEGAHAEQEESRC
jgi:hypothetical protein